MSVAEQLVPTGTWSVDDLHSSVAIEVQHMGLSTFRAGFTDFDASLVSDPDGVELRGAARVESFDVQDEVLRAQVMSPEFLDVERHPGLAFRSTRFGADGDELVVQGELTIKGTTHGVEARGTITAPVADPYGNERLALSLAVVIDRTDFGLGWQMDMPGGGQVLGTDVKLLVSLELVKDA